MFLWAGIWLYFGVFAGAQHRANPSTNSNDGVELSFKKVPVCYYSRVDERPFCGFLSPLTITLTTASSVTSLMYVVTPAPMLAM